MQFGTFNIYTRNVNNNWLFSQIEKLPQLKVIRGETYAYPWLFVAKHIYIYPRINETLLKVPRWGIQIHSILTFLRLQCYIKIQLLRYPFCDDPILSISVQSFASEICITLPLRISSQRPLGVQLCMGESALA